MCTFGKGGAIVPHQHSSSVKLSNQCKQGKGKPYIRRGMKQHTLKSQTIIFRNRCLAWALYVTTRRTACRLVPKTHTRRKKSCWLDSAEFLSLQALRPRCGAKCVPGESLWH
uniref:Uncharacterized protein n=1 Tax=Rhipicephalus microplus TaxID=6941 RepID=A0A6G5A0C8_RHIMP